MRHSLLIVLTVSLAFACANSSEASIQAGDYLNFQRPNPNPAGNFSGGPFAVRKWDAGMTSTGSVLLNSLCLERNEVISLNANSKYYVASITNAAHDGGIGGPNPDPISEATQFIYYQYATGNLSSFDLDPFSTAFSSPTYFDYSTSDSNRALQNAVWSLEQEGTAGLTGNSSDYLDALLNLAAASIGGSNEPWLSRVQVLNLEDMNGGNAQDQLVLISMPEPVSLIVWTSMLGMATLVRRRKAS